MNEDLYHIEAWIGGYKREYVDTYEALDAAIASQWPKASRQGAGGLLEIWASGPIRPYVVARFVFFPIRQRFDKLPPMF